MTAMNHMPNPMSAVNPSVPAGTSRNGYRPVSLRLDSESSVIFAVEPNSLAAEQYRQLRRNLSEHYPEGGTLLITSPGQAEGKTLNAANLAWCLAESGQSTLLLEGDLRRPTLSQVLHCSMPVGVESALRGEVEPRAAVAAVEGLPLHIAGVSNPVRDPSQTIKSASARRFLDWARGEFHWVVIDAPPVLSASETMELSPLADAVLLVVRVRVTPRELLEKSLQLLGNRLRGVILNEASLCWDSYQRYLAGYYGPRPK
jgi:capsular exopolysaccharide synthesis family protein